MKGSFETTESLQGYLHEPDTITGHLSLPTGGSGGTSDYKQLHNKPKINGVTLDGDISSDDLGIGSDGIYVGGGEMPEGCNVQIDPTGEASGIIEDVKINGTSIVTNGVVNIPIANKLQLGVIAWDNNLGVKAYANGNLYIERANDGDVDARLTPYKPITPKNLDYAVKTAMCDGKGAEWTSNEKASARERLGCEWRYIGKIQTTIDVSKLSLSLDENGQPFNLRKFRIVAVNYPNANDYTGWIRLSINNKVWTTFDCFALTGIKQTETKKVLDMELEKIGDYLRVNTIFTSINTTSISSTLGTPINLHAYDFDQPALDGFITEISLMGYQDSVGAGAYFEVWGVDA